MTTVNHTGLAVASAYDLSNVQQATWTPLLNGNVGDAFGYEQWVDRSMTIYGTFGSGGSCAIEGSPDGTNWFVLSNPSTGAALNITAAGAYQVMEMTRFIRPNVTAGDGTTSLTAVLVARLCPSQVGG